MSSLNTKALLSVLLLGVVIGRYSIHHRRHSGLLAGVGVPGQLHILSLLITIYLIRNDPGTLEATYAGRADG